MAIQSPGNVTPSPYAQSRMYPPGTVGMRPMLDGLARNWGWIAFRGIAAILFGVLTIAWPGVTLVTLVALYGAFALVDGVSALIAAFGGGTPLPRWWLGLVGFLGIAAGVLTFMYPGLTAIILISIVAIWSIAMGIMQIVGAIQMRKEIEGEWLLILSGVLSILFGGFILAYPLAGALGIALAIGVFAIMHGVLMVAFSLRLRKMAEVRI